MGWIERIRRYFLRKGYTCDDCGAELFNYPAYRLCAACEEKLLRPVRPCPRCGREGRGEGLCMDCKANPPLFTKGISPFLYRGEAALLINRVKNGNPKLAEYFGEQMAKALIQAGITEPLLIPVPVGKARRREREFNQAERLTERVWECLCENGVAAQTDFSLLVKERETKLQKRMSRKEREENVRGAYRVADRTRCKGKRVVVVDDIMTTGSTGNEIAKRFFKAGAKEVYFLVAAAVPESE